MKKQLLVISIGIALSTAGFVLAGKPTKPGAKPTPVAKLIPKDLKVGSGDVAKENKTAVVHYTGWLEDKKKPDHKGAEFDSSQKPGREPFTFTLGAGQVIKGWDKGVVGMKVGGIRRLVIPPALGYGERGAPGAIPPNATLVFDIELLKVQ